MRSNRRSKLVAIPIALALSSILAGCTAQQTQGYLPGGPDVTNHTSEVIGLWVTSWMVLLIVGLITWGLVIWSAVVYRRRKGQSGFPVQMRYNLPIEILYTIVPLILVLAFFAFTARDQASIEADPGNPDVKIEVFGKRWAFDFNYLNEKVYETGTQARETDDNLVDTNTQPVLYLPVNKKIQIDIESRDVAHSFWIIDFLYKKDMIPGKTNHWYFVPTKEGTYQGKCAELCGEYHSLMLFQVKVVSQDEFDKQMAALEDAGQTGRLGVEYNANTNLPGTAGRVDEE